VQVASIGLLGAIDRFDPERGRDFTTFAIPTIVGELKRYYRDQSWAMKVPRGDKERMLAVNRAAEALSATHGRSPTPLELADRTGLDLEAVLAGLELAAAARPASLDEAAGPWEGEPRTIGESVGGEDPALALVETRDIVDRSVRVLSPRERRIVHLRFVEDLTQSEIGADVGLSQMQVSRILRDVLARLREQARGTSAATAGEAPSGQSSCASGAPCVRV
jgi:RNA polymerase sigma-B factor